MSSLFDLKAGRPWTTNPGIFSFFEFSGPGLGPGTIRDPSGCVGIAEISLGARSKSDLVAFLPKRMTFLRNLGLQALVIHFSGLGLMNISS